jgi:hypothetical protein
MCTASYYKGTAALLVHAVLTAAEHGVVPELMDDLSSSYPGLQERAGRQLAMAVMKSGRYVGEMREIAATQAAAGLPAELFEAMARVYDDLSGRPLASTPPEEASPGLTVEAFVDLAGSAPPVEA